VQENASFRKGHHSARAWVPFADPVNAMDVAPL
jgi:hypothetical protein